MSKQRFLLINKDFRDANFLDDEGRSMTLPLPAPKIETMLKTFDFRFFLNRPETLSPLLEGKYLHWDDLRHRVPPPGRPE